jgi:molecular chaperone GrpE
VIEGILPVLDDFERAIKAKKEAGEDEEKGIGLIYNKLKKTLESNGLKPMDTQPGDEFNDEFHEAITQIPAPDEKLAGKIVDIIEPGYFLNDTVIRFAKVVTGAK